MGNYVAKLSPPALSNLGRATRQLISQINVRLVVRQTCGYKLIDGATIEDEGLG